MRLLGNTFNLAVSSSKTTIYSVWCCNVCKLSIVVSDALHYKHCFLNVNFISFDNDYKFGTCFSWLHSCPKAFHVSDLEWVTFWNKASSILSIRASTPELGALPFRKSVCKSCACRWLLIPYAIFYLIFCYTFAAWVTCSFFSFSNLDICSTMHVSVINNLWRVHLFLH